MVKASARVDWTQMTLFDILEFTLQEREHHDQEANH